MCIPTVPFGQSLLSDTIDCSCWRWAAAVDYTAGSWRILCNRVARGIDQRRFVPIGTVRLEMAMEGRIFDYRYRERFIETKYRKFLGTPGR